MKIFVILLALQCFSVSGQTWVSRARLRDFNNYFVTTSQQLMLEVEKREWCNLKLNDHSGTINQHMYEWHVAGNVTYTNGFLISIQRIDLSNIQALVLGKTVNGVVQATGTVRGNINFRDLTVGFDVLFHQDDGSTHRYTGAYTYLWAEFHVSISKNFTSNLVTASVSSITFSPGAPRMIYLPANNITEVLSRQFLPRNHAGSGNAWASQIMQPILQKIVTTKMEFPSVCFINC